MRQVPNGMAKGPMRSRAKSLELRRTRFTHKLFEYALTTLLLPELKHTEHLLLLGAPVATCFASATASRNASFFPQPSLFIHHGCCYAAQGCWACRKKARVSMGLLAALGVCRDSGRCAHSRCSPHMLLTAHRPLS